MLFTTKVFCFTLFAFFDFCKLGFVLYSMGMFERAVQATTQAILWNEKYGECYFTRGLAYAGLGKKEEAEKDFATALKITREAEDSIYSYCHMYATGSELSSEVCAI